MKTNPKSFRHLSGLLLVAAMLLLPSGCKVLRRAGVPSRTTGEVLRQRPLAYEEQRRFDALFLEALRQKQKGNYDAGYELLTAALSLAPDAAEALYETALLKLSLDSHSDSLHRAEGDSLLQLAVRYAPHNTDYKQTLADRMADRGDYKAAADIYKELAADKPAYETLSTLIALQKDAGDLAGAVRTIEQLELLEGRNEACSIEKFKLYTEMGNKPRAYAAIEELCAEFPYDLRYRVLLGDLYRLQGYNEMALVTYRDVLTLEPDNSYAQISLLAYYKTTGADSLYDALVEEVVLNPHTQNEAKVEAMRGYVADNLNRQADSTQVLRLFRRALDRPQENRSLAELCAGYMTAIGMPVASLAPVMRRILDVEPDYSPARLQLLDILIRTNDMEGAAAVCREGRMYEPQTLVFYYYEALAYITLEQRAPAIACLQAATEHIDDKTDGELASNIYATLGDLYHEEGRRQEAYGAYDKALEHMPNNFMCLNNYAYFLSLDGTRLDEAEAMSRRTIDAEPKSTTFLDTYAWVLFRLKQYTQARIYIDQVLEEAEETADNATLFDHAGDIYYRTGDHAEAVKLWIKALGLSSEADRREQLRQKIRRQRL